MREEDSQPMVISIKEKKKVIEGELVRTAIFAQSKIAEMAVSGSSFYYAVFYKNALIYGDVLARIEDHSFINQAFTKGLVIEAPHPALMLTAPEQPLSMPNKKKLFGELQDHYSFQEIAYIATTLDAFFTKEQLIDIIHKILSHLKRSGKHFKAFQVSRILTSFEPEEDPGQNQLTPHEFQTYADIYNTDLTTLQQKDPFHLEQYCFRHRTQETYRDFLIDTLKEEARYAEAILLWLEAVENGKNPDSIETYTDMAQQIIPFQTWLQILAHAGINPFYHLPEKTAAFLETTMAEGQTEESLPLLFPYLNQLPTRFESLLPSLCTQLDPPFIWQHLDELHPLLDIISTNGDKETIESIIYRLTAYLFEHNDLPTVQQNLTPLRDLFPESPTLHKIAHMLTLSEDPDQMMALGKYYVAFEQWDEAIDCFSWEMEMHPEAPTPVWHLSKMYQHKGMTQEAEVYQKFYAQLQ